MQYCITSSLRVLRNGKGYGLLPGQVAKVYDNVDHRWLEQISARRASSLVREAGERLVVETPEGVRPPIGSPTFLEGPGFVKEVRPWLDSPIVGDGKGVRTLDGRTSGAWRGIRADDPEVMYWTQSERAGLSRVMSPGQWMIPCIGKVTETPDKEFPELSQPCSPVEHKLSSAWFTPMIPIIIGSWGPFLSENPAYEAELEALAWDIQQSHAPRALWAGWAFQGLSDELLANQVLVDKVPPTLMPLPMGGPEWKAWWDHLCATLSPEGLAQAVSAITHVSGEICDSEEIVARDMALARQIMAREPVLV